MKIRKYGIIMGMILVFCMSGCSFNSGNEKGKDDTTNIEAENSNNGDGKQEDVHYPKIVYIDNTTYYGTEELCETVPRKSPDGRIETFVSKEIMPDSYNSANFGSEYGHLEYMLLEDKRLIVRMGENWYYFDSKEDESNNDLNSKKDSN